jgi:hypothetical protein
MRATSQAGVIDLQKSFTSDTREMGPPWTRTRRPLVHSGCAWCKGRRPDRLRNPSKPGPSRGTKPGDERSMTLGLLALRVLPWSSRQMFDPGDAPRSFVIEQDRDDAPQAHDSPEGATVEGREGGGRGDNHHRLCESASTPQVAHGSIHPSSWVCASAKMPAALQPRLLTGTAAPDPRIASR